MPMVKPSISTHKYTTFFINTIKVQVGFGLFPPKEEKIDRKNTNYNHLCTPQAPSQTTKDQP